MSKIKLLTFICISLSLNAFSLDSMENRCQDIREFILYDAFSAQNSGFSKQIENALLWNFFYITSQSSQNINDKSEINQTLTELLGILYSKEKRSEFLRNNLLVNKLGIKQAIINSGLKNAFQKLEDSTLGHQEKVASLFSKIKSPFHQAHQIIVKLNQNEYKSFFSKVLNTLDQDLHFDYQSPQIQSNLNQSLQKLKEFLDRLWSEGIYPYNHYCSYLSFSQLGLNSPYNLLQAFQERNKTLDTEQKERKKLYSSILINKRESKAIYSKGNTICEYKNKKVIDKITIHHTAGHRDQSLKIIENFHKIKKNWSDIAYNYLFYPEFSDYNDLPYSNSFQEARSLNIVGAHNSANFEYQQATPAASELREDTYEEAQKYVTCYRYLSNGEREEISTQEYFEEYDPKAISENLRSYSIAIANESEGADQDELAEESMNHLAKMICDIANNQGLNIKYIDTHHNTKGKPCPGKNMREQLAKSIEKKVRICALNKNIKFLERGVEYPDEDHLH